jgi:heme A synthase
VTTTARPGAAAAGARARTALFSSVAGLTSLAVLLQGLWAGLFVPTGKGGPYDDSWVDVHNWGARITLLLALVTAVVGFVTLRARRELWIGAIVLTVLVAVEVGLGGAISDGKSGAAAAVHVPLALVIMALTVWLPLRARHAT